MNATPHRLDPHTEAPPHLAGPQAGTFLLQRPRAARRSYHLLLEQEAMTCRWALPQGLPPRPGIRRRALPLAAASPRAGSGRRGTWIHTQGHWEITQKEPDGFHLGLRCGAWTATYRLRPTRGRSWHLERLDRPAFDWLTEPVEPMLAAAAEAPPTHGDYLYEVKWDGIRALITVDEGRVTVRTRSQREVTDCFPELVRAAAALRTTSACFDGEIVCPDQAGRPVLAHVLSRVRTTAPLHIARARQRHPAVCYLFDCLYLDGRPLVGEPLRHRQQGLRHAVADPGAYAGGYAPGGYRISQTETDGQGLWEAVQQWGLEGLVAKPPDSPYRPGQRRDGWLKIKVRQTRECLILGYTPGPAPGSAHGSPSFRALHLGQGQGSTLQYLGKVGSGFTARTRQGLLEALTRVETIACPFPTQPAGAAHTVWLQPPLRCQVQCAPGPATGLREAVFLRLEAHLE